MNIPIMVKADTEWYSREKRNFELGFKVKMQLKGALYIFEIIRFSTSGNPVWKCYHNIPYLP